MTGPRTYIVRIYRQGFATLDGVVEDAATSGSRPFRDLAALGRHLLAPIPPRSAPSGVGDPDSSSTKGE